jgi:hypothetical protein
MTPDLDAIGRLLLEAARISNHRRFVIAGSLSAIGAVMQAPEEMTMSHDLDFYPELDPERGFVEIASQLGDTSAFHQVNGIYADPITPRLLALPQGWEVRLVSITFPGGVVGRFMEPNDVAVGKLARAELHDMRWVRAGLTAGILSIDTIRERIALTDNLSGQDAVVTKMRLEQLEGLLARPPRPSA